MSILLPTRRPLLGSPFNAFDRDAQTYIRAVEAADGQTLEAVTRNAINTFIVGCKADGIWGAIKASCILAGARTLAGCLVPLKGTAPTNFNFVAGDYNRKTGLVGDGSTKYLNSNRANNADPQDSKHLCVYTSGAPTSGTVRAFLGAKDTTGTSALWINPDGTSYGFQLNAALPGARGITQGYSGFIGLNRSSSATIVTRWASSNQSSSITSQIPYSASLNVLAGAKSGDVPSFYTNARLAFYSIGESLDLALLDARVTTLINAFAALP